MIRFMTMTRRYVLLSLGLTLTLMPFAEAADIKPGDKPPHCALAPLGGGPGKDLGQYRGKVVYVDFWASWCGPCAQSFPFMNKLHQDLHARGLEVVGVNLDEEPQEALGFLAKTPAQFTILADASGQCPQDFGVRAMPSSYLIDRNGVIRHVHLGFKTTESGALRQQVEALLDQPAR